MADNSSARPLTVFIWIAVAAVLLIGAYKLFQPHRSHDQQVLIDKSK